MSNRIQCIVKVKKMKIGKVIKENMLTKMKTQPFILNLLLIVFLLILLMGVYFRTSWHGILQMEVYYAISNLCWGISSLLVGFFMFLSEDIQFSFIKNTWLHFLFRDVHILFSLRWTRMMIILLGVFLLASFVSEINTVLKIVNGQMNPADLLPIVPTYSIKLESTWTNIPWVF